MGKRKSNYGNNNEETDRKKHKIKHRGKANIQHSAEIISSASNNFKAQPSAKNKIRKKATSHNKMGKSPKLPERKPMTMQNLLSEKLKIVQQNRLEKAAVMKAVKDEEIKEQGVRHNGNKQSVAVGLGNKRIESTEEEQNSQQKKKAIKGKQSSVTDSVKESNSDSAFTESLRDKNRAQSKGMGTDKKKNKKDKEKKHTDLKDDEEEADCDSIDMENEEDSKIIANADSGQDIKKSKKDKKGESSVVTGTVEETYSIATNMGNQEDEEEEDPEKAAIRKKKREKRKQKKLEKERIKQQNKEKAGTAKAAALDYINQWKNSRTEWKFLKVRQVWLLQNMFDQALVDDVHFEILLEYLEGLQGRAREVTVSEAEEVLGRTETDEGPSAVISDRARQIIQLLSED